ERANNLESSTSNGHAENEDKSFEIGTEIDQETVNSCYDLCESIPGLYRLLDLCKDKGSNGLVDKILISQQHLKKLCNEMVPNSLKSISKIQFEQLNSCHVRLIGCYGRNDLIAKLLLNKNVIDQVMPGIYLQKLPSISEGINSNLNQFLVIHWSENGCYEDSASSYRKKNMTNLHRYLTKLTTHQLCLMDADSDVKNFDWSLLSKNFDDENGENKEKRAFIHKFEVRKSQEQKEDFELFEGFNLPLSMSNIQNSYAPKNLDGPPLHPLIVCSASNLRLLTRKMKPVTTADKCSRIIFDSLINFQKYLKQKLKIQKCALSINRNKMTIQKLQVFVEDGINVPDLFLKYNKELKEQEADKVKIVNKVSDLFESLKSDHKNDKIQLGEEIKKIDEIHPDIIPTLKNEIFNISTDRWKYLKTRLIFASHCDLIKKSIIFCDEEQDFSILVKKYKARCFLFCASNGILLKTNQIVDKINDEAKKIFDNVFVKQISVLNDEAVTNMFLNAYIEWKEQDFVQNVKRIVQDFKEIVEKNAKVEIDKNYEEKIKQIEEDYFESICKKIEAKYQADDLIKGRLTILNLKIDEHKNKYYYLDCEVSEKLCFTIHDVNLDQSDIEEMDKKEFFIPKPRLSIYDTSFNIDPEIYEFKTIAQFSRTYLLFLWNIINNKLEIYIGGIKNLQNSLDSQTAQKKLQIGRNFIIALNEPKRMIAIYENDKGLLYTYSLDDEHHNIHLQHRNIHISQWYKSNIPQITNLFFIKSTEDVCFVEKNGSARIYSLINGNFRPGTAQLPGNCTRVISTPDGACFVAFVKEKFFGKTSEVEDKVIEIISEDTCTKIQVENPSDIKSKLLSTNTIELSNIDITTKNDKEIAIISQKNLDNSTESETQTFKGMDKENETISENMYTKMQVENRFDINNEAKSSSIESLDDLTESKLQQNTLIQSKINNSQALNGDIVRGYVFFLEKFNKNANKVIDIPFAYPTLELFQFCSLANKQTHLTTIDLHNNTFLSLIVKVTQTKAKYRFEQKTAKKSLGKVKIESNDPHTVFGQNTKFTNDLHVGDILVISNENFQIIKVVDDCELKIVNQQQLNFEEWQQFNIEPRTKVNGLFDVYSMVFTKYAITTPFSEKDELLKLTIVLELSSKLDIDNYMTKFQAYLRKLFEKYKKETKKPMGHLEKFSVNCINFESYDNIANEFTEHKFGDWIIDLFCLIPIQIAVAHDNKFIPIRDGFLEKTEQNVFDDGFGLIGNISKAISFGWYESIFEHYSDLEVKVISSMGEQSCGKSYLLNHCLGTTFDGSAMRCTEGIWMSLVKIDKILYVALDFEGLASIERSAQEETFLQLFNASLSNLVLFKSNFVISRDISSMFQRFQDQAKYFGDDPDIFQACFCIVIKDVAFDDRNGVVEEFRSKFANIVNEEEEDNFISKLYNNIMSIVAWPIFTDPSFYTSLEEFKLILNEQESQYKNARMFLEKAKLKKFLNNAISFGYEQKNDNQFHDKNELTKYLTNRDDGTSIPDNDVFLSEIFDHINDSTKIVHDTELRLFEENGNFVDISFNLRKFFEEKVYARGSIPDPEWVTNLDNFFKFIVSRRIKRVNEWFEKNLARFSKENNEVIITNFALEREINRLNLFWDICRLKCYKCGLSCLKTSRHDDNPDDTSHDCLTDHECHHECEFKEAHPDGINPICEHFAAHDGKHECSFLHLCGAPCIYAGKKNCQKALCAKEHGHENTKGNETHKCNSTIHYCGEPCSLNAKKTNGKYVCKNECVIPCEIEHDVHKCQKDVCPFECPIKNCQRQCDKKDHFHAFEENAIHFCGEEHDCQKKCEEDGICKILTEPTAIEDEYENRLPCCVKIPPYKFEHTGQKHVHEIKKPHKCNSGCPNDDKHIIEQENKQNFHFCDEKCPYCAYYCTKPYGHEKVDNTTTHGNMYLTTFTCEDDDFEFEGNMNVHINISNKGQANNNSGHRLTIGDRGDFVLCHKLCENARHHRHIDYCKTPDVCKPGGAKSEGSFEHIPAILSPNPSREKDYVSHRIFWERTGFKDPYSANYLEEFKKCDHHCIDEKHDNKERSYCTQKIFHPSLDHKSETIPDNTGYISVDGHHFSCESPTKIFGNFHIIFVVDRSGSMSSEDCKPKCDNSKLIDLKDNHNNRFGAVIESVFTFIEARKNSRKSIRVGQMTTDRDTVSLVLFNNSATVIFENRSLSHSEVLLEEMMKHFAEGTTDFAEGIKCASDLIKKYHDPLKVNLVIFLSDGLGSLPTNELRDFCQLETNLGIYLYTIKFTNSLIGQANDFIFTNTLEKMVKTANKYLPKCTDKDSLKCKYVLAIDEIELINHFTHIAESLRKHKPTLM
ncbi:25121_t:CDS:10, partial [Gigaspora margarita]